MQISQEQQQKEQQLFYKSLIQEFPDKIEENLWLGNLSHSQDLPKLLELEIKIIISINAVIKFPLPFSEYFIYLPIALGDAEEQDLINVLKLTCPFIKANQERYKILVHCNAGASRSASVVIGHLIVNRGMSFEEAFNFVKNKRFCICPNEGFVEQLKTLKKDCFNETKQK